MRKTFVVLLLIFAAAPALHAQDWVAGVEANESASFSYLTHYSRSGAVTWWQSVSFLTYQWREAAGTGRVNSPGVSAGAMYRWTRRNLSAGAGAGYEVRWTERRPPEGVATNETEQGPIVEGDLAQRFAPRTTGRVAARWSGANDWLAASADLRQEISARLRVGPQVIWQGNEDLKVLSFGGFVEIPMGSSALQVRAGQSRTEYRDGTRDSSPYFSAGIVVPF